MFGATVLEHFDKPRNAGELPVTANTIAEALGGLPAESGHAADLAEQALKSALTTARTRQG
jgi:hypothetical protein